MDGGARPAGPEALTPHRPSSRSTATREFVTRPAESPIHAGPLHTPRTGRDQPSLEAARLEAQRAFDASRPLAARNRLGQYATPPALAQAVVRLGLSHLPAGAALRFLDPAVGTGAFYSALLALRGERPIDGAEGIELDPVVAGHARALWGAEGLTVHEADFTQRAPPPGGGANLLLANPPYVRHHHLDREAKASLHTRLSAATGLRLSGLAGLYCYFLLLSRPWMADGGIAVWLIPSEFMDVKYGEAVRRFLLQQVTLHRVHRADPTEVQFGDALVSSAVVVLENRPPASDHQVRFTFGGSLEAPRVDRWIDLPTLSAQPKWSRYPVEPDARPVAEGTPLGELFSVQRGIATGCNALFILDSARVAALGLPAEVLRPILPPPRRLPMDRVDALPDGSPALVRPAWLLSCALPEAELRSRYPTLWQHLEAGIPAVSTAYLCSKRRPWYAQERRDPAPLLCTYMGRGRSGRPFRFILNRSRAIAGNVYLMLQPKPPLQRALETDPTALERIWRYLNGLDAAALTREGRVYGGGLFKLEPRELGAVVIPPSVLGASPP